jgi:hypothetical protein
LRPETFFTGRALTKYTVTPRDSSSSNQGIPYTPVDCIATVSTPQAVNPSVQVLGETRKLADRFVVPVRWHGHEVTGRPDVDAGGGGMGQFENALAFGHDVLHDLG